MLGEFDYSLHLSALRRLLHITLGLTRQTRTNTWQNGAYGASKAQIWSPACETARQRDREYYAPLLRESTDEARQPSTCEAFELVIDRRALALCLHLKGCGRNEAFGLYVTAFNLCFTTTGRNVATHC